MSLRDFNEPSQPLHTDPAGNGGSLGSFHTINPEGREPSNTPKIVGAIAMALMVGAAGIGLYAYSGSSQPKPVVADNGLPQPPAPVVAPIAPPPAQATQQAANTPASTATANDSTPAPAPVKEASGKPVKAKHHVASNDSGSTSMPAANNSSSSSASTGTAPSQQAAVQAPQQTVTPSAAPMPSAPQPSPSDLATNSTQSGQAVPQGATSASDMPAQNGTAQQPAQLAPQQPSVPAEQSGAAPAPAQ